MGSKLDPVRGPRSIADVTVVLCYLLYWSKYFYVDMVKIIGILNITEVLMDTTYCQVEANKYNVSKSINYVTLSGEGLKQIICKIDPNVH